MTTPPPGSVMRGSTSVDRCAFMRSAARTAFASGVRRPASARRCNAGRQEDELKDMCEPTPVRVGPCQRDEPEC